MQKVLINIFHALITEADAKTRFMAHGHNNLESEEPDQASSVLVSN